MELSKRMNAVAQMVPAGHIAADVGCDHGFVSIYLIEHGICPHVYAADVRPGPLARAREHIEKSGLSAYITPVLSDGLKEVPVGEPHGRGKKMRAQAERADAVDNAKAGDMGGAGTEDTENAESSGAPEPEDADVMIAAGMGGRLTIRILSDVPKKTARLSYVVLEPQSEVWLVRRWLWENGFVIVDEDMVFEDGKFYPVIRAKNSRCPEPDANAARGGMNGQGCPSRNRDGELERANAALASLCSRMAAAGFSKERRRTAAECFGPVLMHRKSAVLLSFLEHTIEKDSGLLREMPEALRDPEKAERIEGRRKELKERIWLAERVADMLKG